MKYTLVVSSKSLLGGMRIVEMRKVFFKHKFIPFGLSRLRFLPGYVTLTRKL